MTVLAPAAATREYVKTGVVVWGGRIIMSGLTNNIEQVGISIISPFLYYKRLKCVVVVIVIVVVVVVVVVGVCVP